MTYPYDLILEDLQSAIVAKKASSRRHCQDHRIITKGGMIPYPVRQGHITDDSARNADCQCKINSSGQWARNSIWTVFDVMLSCARNRANVGMWSNGRCEIFPGGGYGDEH